MRLVPALALGQLLGKNKMNSWHTAHSEHLVCLLVVCQSAFSTHAVSL